MFRGVSFAGKPQERVSPVVQINPLNSFQNHSVIVKSHCYDYTLGTAACPIRSAKSTPKVGGKAIQSRMLRTSKGEWKASRSSGVLKSCTTIWSGKDGMWRLPAVESTALAAMSSPKQDRFLPLSLDLHSNGCV